jgi:8-oxo-dGTP pyrophosphatase MutT (NUDIX family)
MSERVPFSTHGFSVVVCRNFDGKWLAVKETRNRGWWLPAGLVDPGEDFYQAAHRECLEEAYVRIKLKGILRVEHSVYGPTHARMRVIFFAVPTDQNQVPKTISDRESEEARWVTLHELKQLAKIAPGLRGPELYDWGSYIEKGGSIAPIHFLCREDESIPMTVSLQTSDFLNKESQDFFSAIEKGDENKIKAMLLAGFNPNLKINTKEWTPLHLACHTNQEKIVSLLLLAGSSIDAKTHKNRNVLHFAAQSTPSILLLILIGIHRFENSNEIINQGDDTRDTPLHYAASMGGKGLAWNLLLENGANPSIQNKKGISPMDIVSNE